LQGTSLGQLTPQIGILIAWLIVPFVISLRIFRWR
jgi:ABC-2 type transport system permease protein